MNPIWQVKTATNPSLKDSLKDWHRMVGCVKKKSIIIKGNIRNVKLFHPMRNFGNNVCWIPLTEMILEQERGTVKATIRTPLRGEQTDTIQTWIEVKGRIGRLLVTQRIPSQNVFDQIHGSICLST